MRDPRYVAAHRGGPLAIEDHRLLILWAIDCAHHVLRIFSEASSDERLSTILQAANEWAAGKLSVGEARDAAFTAHAVARETRNKAAQAVARACGHAVATAHMADHALQAAEYSLRAVSEKKLNVEEEKSWQNAGLPDPIRELVLSSRKRV